MSEFTAQRDRLIFHIKAVDTVAAAADNGRDDGTVYGFNQYGDAYEHWVLDNAGEPEIRAWEVAIDDEGIQHIRFQQGFRHIYYPWRIFGYHSLEDDRSNPTSFDALVDRADLIADAFAGDQRLNGAALDMSEEPNVSTPVPITVGGGFLCWGIDISLTTYLIR